MTVSDLIERRILLIMRRMLGLLEQKRSSQRLGCSSKFSGSADHFKGIS